MVTCSPGRSVPRCGAPDIKEKMLAQGFEPMGNSPAELTKFIGEEIPRWERVVKNAGIKPG